MYYCPRNLAVFLDCLSFFLDFKFKKLLIIYLSSWHHIISLYRLLSTKWLTHLYAICLSLYRLSINLSHLIPCSQFLTAILVLLPITSSHIIVFDGIFLFLYIFIRHFFMHSSLYEYYYVRQIILFSFLSLWPIVSKIYPYSYVNIQLFVSNCCRILYNWHSLCFTCPPVMEFMIASHHYKQHCDKYHGRWPPLYKSIFENCIQRRILFVIRNI